MLCIDHVPGWDINSRNIAEACREARVSTVTVCRVKISRGGGGGGGGSLVPRLSPQKTGGGESLVTSA